MQRFVLAVLALLVLAGATAAEEPSKLTVGSSLATEGLDPVVRISIRRLTNWKCSASVRWRTVPNTAIANADYVHSSGTVSWGIDQIETIVEIPLRNDALLEPNETFQVVITDPVNATIYGSGIGTGTIKDDESVPLVATFTSRGARKEGQADNDMVFDVSLSKPANVPVQVSLYTIGGRFAPPYSATMGTSFQDPAVDFLATSRVIVFHPGEARKEFAVRIRGDRIRESYEYFHIMYDRAASTIPMDRHLKDPAAMQVGNGVIYNDD